MSASSGSPKTTGICCDEMSRTSRRSRDAALVMTPRWAGGGRLPSGGGWAKCKSTLGLQRAFPQVKSTNCRHATVRALSFFYR